MLQENGPVESIFANVVPNTVDRGLDTSIRSISAGKQRMLELIL